MGDVDGEEGVPDDPESLDLWFYDMTDD